MQLNTSATTDRGPNKVNHKLAIFYFLWMGGSSIINWCAVLNSLDYFDAKFPNHNVAFIFPLVVYIAQLITTVVITQMSSAFSYSTRIICSLIITTAMTILIPLEAVLLEQTMLGLCLLLGL